MSNLELSFTVHQGGETTPLTFAPTNLVVAGWTGRDAAERDKHIAELEALGVARPASTPIFYRASARRLTTDDSIEVCGPDSSGEAEFILLADQGRLLVGTASDHTDRKVETYNVTVSKQMCDKPMAADLWDFEDVADHWDRLTLRSHAWIDGTRVLYQEGAVSRMLPPGELISTYTGGEHRLPDGTAMLSGTLAVEGGIRPATRFEFELEDPVLNRRIGHGYDITTLPNRG